MSFPKKILIIGGGFGGVRAGLDLAKHNYSDLEITLIDKDGFHYFTPEYYKLVYFNKDDGIDADFFKKAIYRFSVPLYEIFKGKRNFKLIIDEAEDIDFEKNKVKTKSGAVFSYDYLILALGSETEYFGNLSIREFVYPFKTIQDSLNARNAVDELFYREAKHDPIQISVVGGGLTGCEVAASLSETVSNLAKIHSHPRENVSVEILEGSYSILPQFDKWTRKKVESRLKKMGVKISVNRIITEVKEDNVITKDGKIFPYDLLIWTVGVKANRLVEKLKGVKLDKKNLILVDEYMRIPPFENVFAIGDLASFKDAATGMACPMTAQSAISEGRYVAYAIKRLMHKRKIYRHWPERHGFIIPLGKNYGIFKYGFLRLWGRPVVWLRKLANLRYLMSILPIRRALFFWRKW